MVPARPWGRGRRSWLPAFSAVRARRRGQAADGDSTGRPRKHWSAVQQIVHNKPLSG